MPLMPATGRLLELVGNGPEIFLAAEAKSSHRLVRSETADVVETRSWGEADPNPFLG